MLSAFFRRHPNAASQRGGLTSLFVRGGEVSLQQVIVDGVTINEPGGTFDFGTLPLDQADRMSSSRTGTLYGSDAMTSVVRSGRAPATLSRPRTPLWR
jgi:outer membrane cobalamin receptor